LHKAVAKLGLPSEKEKPVALTTGEGEVPTACGKTWLPGIVQQLVAKIPLRRFFPPSEQEPVGISDYVTKLTKSFLPVRHADRSKKA
jgi:hypothetical protein